MKCISNRLISIFFFMFCGLTGLLYWVMCLWIRPSEPLSSVIMHRHSDFQYFAMIIRIVSSRLGDFTIFENYKKGVIAFPALGLIHHLLLQAVFGLYSFILSDVLVATARGWVIVRFVKTFVSKHNTAYIIAFFGFCFTSAPLVDAIVALTGIPIAPFWSFRIPRDYNTSVFSIFLLGSIVPLLKVTFADPSFRPIFDFRSSIMLALGFSALVNSDIYFALIFALVLLYIFVVDVFRHERVARHWIVMALLLVPLNSLFVYQVLHSPSDLSERIGRYPTAGGLVLVTGASYFVTGISIFALALSIILKSLYRKNKIEGSETSWIVIFLLGVTGLASQIASFVLSSFAHQGIQEYHFPFSSSQIANLILVSCTMVCVALAYLRIQKLMSLVLKRAIVILAVVATGFLYLKFQVKFHVAKISDSTSLMSPFISDGPANYREKFDELIQELAKPEYSPDLVMGTWDFQVGNWWNTFTPGFTYLPDTCWSLVDKAEIESRIISFAKISNLNEQEFANLIDNFVIFTWFISSDRYQANRFYTYAPLTDYTVKVLQHIKESHENWATAWPISERKRLIENFVKPISERRLDIVVNNKTWYMTKLILPGKFKLSYQNEIFEVYRRTD